MEYIERNGDGTVVEFKLPGIGLIKEEKILAKTDFPLLTVCRDETGRGYLALCEWFEEGEEQFLITPIGERELLALVSDKLSLYDAFPRDETPCWYIKLGETVADDIVTKSELHPGRGSTDAGMLFGTGRKGCPMNGTIRLSEQGARDLAENLRHPSMEIARVREEKLAEIRSRMRIAHIDRDTDFVEAEGLDLSFLDDLAPATLETIDKNVQ